MTRELDTICSLRVGSRTTEKDVINFIDYLFEGCLDDYILEDLLDKFRLFKEDNCVGRISYSLTTQMLTIKEDKLRL